MKLTKVYPIASFKALEDEGPGKFEAVVSVFGNVDFQGDRSMPGMFKNTLNKWRKSGDPVPCVWSHDWLNPDAFIGDSNPNEMMEMLKPIGKNGTGGLKVKGTMDVHKPFAAQVFDLLTSRRVKEWSFSYDTVREKIADDGANELLEVDLIEFGPCLKGANPATYTIGAKSALESELKEAYDRGKIWQQRVDRIAGWAAYDPQVAAMLTKTYTEGSSPKVSANEARVDEGLPELEEKAASKPWHVEKRGDEFCVIKDSDSSVVSCHDTEEDANAHVRAMYANEASAEPDAEKSMDEVHAEALAENLLTKYSTPLSTTSTSFDINYTMSTANGQTTWSIAMPEPSGEKIGRVIGAKAAEELKTDLTEAITGAVDRFVEKINAPGEEKSEDRPIDPVAKDPDEEHETKAEEPVEDLDADIKAKLAELFGENQGER